MSLPPLVKESEGNLPRWQRTIRDAVNALIRRTSGTGLTSERPANPDVGVSYYDATLKVPVWWDGSAWRNAAGNVV